MQESMKFSGNTRECLAHYASNIRGSDGGFTLEAREPLVTFMGREQRETVYRWLKGEFQPVGENLVRIRYFLVRQGYQVVELEKLSPPIWALGEMIALRELLLKDAQERVDHYDLLRLLHGTQQPLPAVLERIDALVQARQRSGKETTSAEPQQDAPVPTLEERVGCQCNPDDACRRYDREHVVRSLSALIQAALPLAERILSDGFRTEDRQLLRSITPGDGVFRLSNMFNRLCSEKAREIAARKDGE